MNCITMELAAKTFLPQIIQIQELSGNRDRNLLAHLAAVPD